MRLASYNIRKAVGLDWRRDPDRVLSVIRELDADIVVLQEADKRTGRRSGVLPTVGLQQAGYKIAEVSMRPDSHGWHGNVILHRDGLNLIESGRIELPCVEPRGAVRARFGALEVVGVHLALTRGTRAKQIRALKNHAERHRGPLIIAGDFNEWRTGRYRRGQPWSHRERAFTVRGRWRRWTVSLPLGRLRCYPHPSIIHPMPNAPQITCQS